MKWRWRTYLGGAGGVDPLDGELAHGEGLLQVGQRLLQEGHQARLQEGVSWCQNIRLHYIEKISPKVLHYKILIESPEGKS